MLPADLRASPSAGFHPRGCYAGDMEERLRIGELAKRSGVSDSTIRYYEREKLLRPDGRTAANYRTYQPSALGRLRFIRAAQASGLSIQDIRALLQVQDGVTSACPEVQEIVDSRLEEITLQMSRLRHVQRVLRRYREACGKTARGGPCPVLEELGETG